MFFVYKITFNDGRFYFGARYNKNANSKDLGVTYFSSSPLVQQLLFQHGSNNVQFEIIGEFSEKQECRNKEYSLINEYRDHNLSLNRQFSESVRNQISSAHKAGKYDKRNLSLSEKIKSHWDTNKETRSNQNRGRTWKLDPETAKRISSYITPFTSETASLCANTIWINDGKINKRIKNDSIIPAGFSKGRMFTPWNKKTK